MSQDDPKHPDHLHADQDEVGGTTEQPYGEQQEGNRTGGESSEHGVSAGKPFGHDEVGDEPGIDVPGEGGEQS